MGSEWSEYFFESAPLIIEDGDRGKNYPKRSEFTSTGHCLFLNTGNVTQTGFNFSDVSFISEERDRLLRKGKLKRGDVVLTTRGTVGNVAYFGQRVLCDHIRINSGMVILRADPSSLDPRFLYLFVRSELFSSQVEGLTTGSAQPQLPIRDLRKVRIGVPDLWDQKAIAHLLGTFDDKIDLNRQMNVTLEAMAQALFKSWFVDFDPVIDNALAAGNPIPEPLHARAEARKALGDQRKPLPAAIQHQFPDRFVLTEEMGWVPEGWMVNTVGEQVEIMGGGTPSTKNPIFWDDGVHAFCTPKDMSRLDSIVVTFTERYLTDAGVQKITSGQLPAGVVLMSSRAPIGYLAISNIPVSVNQGVIAMLPNDSYGAIYLLSWAHFNMRQITDRANGSTFMEISKKNFRPIPFLVPNSGVLNAFNQQAQAVYSKVLSVSENIEEVTKLRDILLPKLLSGELRVPEVETTVTSALAAKATADFAG